LNAARAFTLKSVEFSRSRLSGGKALAPDFRIWQRQPYQRSKFLKVPRVRHVPLPDHDGVTR